MKAPDLEVVFGKSKAPGEGMGAMEDEEGMEAVDEDAEMDEALDAAIDSIFATEDPTERREAFKSAIRLCKDAEASY